MCSFLQGPQLSELVCFVSWELTMAFCIFRRHRICLVDHVDLICSMYSWWEGFGASLAMLPLGFQLWFYFYLYMWIVHWDFAPEAAWRAWVCPYEGQVWRWCSCLCCRGSGSTWYSVGLVAKAAGNIVL